MRIKLSPERKEEIANALSGYYQEQFDEELSEYRAMTLVEFLLQKIGPSQYNQAVTDVRKFLTEKVEELDTEFYEPENL
ncbi:MAG: DUF2164 domain-containing protein [Sneathiella sp.]